MIKLLVARSMDGCIGKDGKLPWDIPSELKHFAKTTKGKTLIVGLNTYLSMLHVNWGDRTVYVVTSKYVQLSRSNKDSRVIFVAEPLKVLAAHHRFGEDIIVIGGKQLYESCLPYCQEFIVTTVMKNYEGDTYLDLFNGIETYSSDRTIEVDPDLETMTPGYRIEYRKARRPKSVKAILIDKDEASELLGKSVEEVAPYASLLLTVATKTNYIVNDINDSYYAGTVKSDIEYATHHSVHHKLVKSTIELIREHLNILPDAIYYTAVKPAVLVYNVISPNSKMTRLTWATMRLQQTQENANNVTVIFPKEITNIPHSHLDTVIEFLYTTNNLTIINLPTNLHKFVLTYLKRHDITYNIV